MLFSDFVGFFFLFSSFLSFFSSITQKLGNPKARSVKLFIFGVTINIQKAHGKSERGAMSVFTVRGGESTPSSHPSGAM